MDITFFDQIDFDCPRLAQFINRTVTPTLRALDKAHVQFNGSSHGIAFLARSWTLEVAISCRESDLQVSSIAQLCNSSLPSPSTVEDFYIEGDYSQLVWQNDPTDDTLLLQLLLPFTVVKNLYLSEIFAPGIAAALQKLVVGRITEVLPSLQNIFVEELKSPEHFQANIGQFFAA